MSTSLAIQTNQVSNWNVPSLGNLNAYITAVLKLPMLTLEEEQKYARQLKDHNDLEAAGKLIMSHLRLVVSISRQYLGYGFPHEDLIGEGNIGLMKAVKRFDPDQGVRLVSYALHWIKAEIQDFVLRNWSLVKIATTKPQRKLFFKLRSLKNRFLSEDAMINADALEQSLNPDQVLRIATELDVKPEEVLEMEKRLSGGDVNLDPTSTNEEDDFQYGPASYLTNPEDEPTAIIESHRRDILSSDGVALALESLDARSRKIIEERWLKVNDDNSGGMTLHELAAIYNVSAERIRQIEVQAMKKMKTVLENIH